MDMSLKALIDVAEEYPIPPVDTWSPSHHGEIDIFIDDNGVWFHEGGEFTRKDLMRLFSRILVCDKGEYYLRTPVEQLKIRVADVPFVIALVDVRENKIECVTQCGDEVTINKTHPIELREYQGQQVPYVLVRSNLWARFSRNAYYELLNSAEENEAGIGVRSEGCFFRLG